MKMDFLKNLKVEVAKSSPGILIGIGIVGMIGAAVKAVYVTPKALKLIEEKKKELGKEKLTKVETVCAAGKTYIPSVIGGSLAIACILGGNSINVRRNAALATAYTLSKNALKDFETATVETIGEKQTLAIKDTVAKNKIEKNPISTTEVIMTGKGKTLFYDGMRYFESDIEEVKSVINKLNYRLMSEMYISLNDFYYELNLRPSPSNIGDELGWNINEGLIEPYFSAQITEDGRPCIVIEYRVAPRYNYAKSM